ncbi:MAG TPA: GNAT family N-acetyltransferase [Ktedonobacterales bacterium]
MMSNLAIRDARDDERDAIRALTLAAYADYAAQPFWQGFRRTLLATLDAQGVPIERIVAARAGRLVGSVWLYPPRAQAYVHGPVSASWPEVRLMAVAPDARGQGIGAALLRECERRARLGGATTLGLHTHDAMRAAIRLYERAGFVRAPELDFQPPSGVLVKGYLLLLGDDRGDAPGGGDARESEAAEAPRRAAADGDSSRGGPTEQQ